MSAGTQILPEPDPRSYAALRNPTSRTYLVFAAMAMMADHVEHVISYWMLYVEFQSPALAGFAVVSHWVPFLVGSIWAGALADRYDPRRIIQIGMGLFMAVSAGWGVLFLTDSLARWHAVVLLIVHGCAGALWAPAAQVMIHDVVGSRQLQSAIRLMATSITLGTLLGPAVGGFLLLNLGPSYGIFVNVAFYLPLALWLIRNPARVHTERFDRSMKRFADLFSALREISAVPVVFSMTLLAALASMLIGTAHQPQMPQFARDFGFGYDGMRYTLLLAAYATGAVTAGIVLEARALLSSNPKTAFALAMMWCVAMGGFAASESYVLAIALLLCAGFLDLSFNSMARTLAQLHAPPDLRGRAIGLYNVGSLGGRTFSGITVGFGGGVIGIHWSLGLSAVVLLLSLGVVYLWAARSWGIAVVER